MIQDSDKIDVKNHNKNALDSYHVIFFKKNKDLIIQNLKHENK